MTDLNKSLSDLTNRFWALDNAHRFSSAQVMLYFYWLHEFSQSGEWRLARPSLAVATRLRLTEKALATAREVLVRRGLLRYEPGTKARAAVWELSPPLPTGSTSAPEASYALVAHRGGQHRSPGTQHAEVPQAPIPPFPAA